MESSKMCLHPQGAPPKHGNIEEHGESSYSQARKFTELPLSEYTKEGLKASNFVTLTAIQRFALPQSLCGRDVFGAAKTGSGKTLAFLIPVSPLASDAAKTCVCTYVRPQGPPEHRLQNSAPCTRRVDRVLAARMAARLCQ